MLPTSTMMNNHIFTTIILNLFVFGSNLANARGLNAHCLTNNDIDVSLESSELSVEAKCYIACLFNCTSFMMETGELNVVETLSPSLTYFEPSVGNELNKTLHECLNQAEKFKGDPCEIGYQTALCWAKPMNAYMMKLTADVEAGHLYETIKGKEPGLFPALLISLFSNNSCIKM